MKNPLLLISRSLALDIDWVKTPGIPEKWRFLIMKYFFLLAPWAHWNTAAQTFRISMWKQHFVFPRILQIAHVQSIFINHMHLQAFIRPHATIVDVGTHIGEFALFARTALKADRVFSFEPAQEAYRLLNANTPTRIFNTAIGTPLSMELHINEQSGMSSGLATPHTVRTETVPCISLDEVPEIQALPSIDLLKINVEGMEYDVIISSPRTIQKSQYITIECSLHRNATQDIMHLLLLLRRISKNIQLVHVGHVIVNADTDEQEAVECVFAQTL